MLKNNIGHNFNLFLPTYFLFRGRRYLLKKKKSEKPTQDISWFETSILNSGCRGDFGNLWTF